LKYFSQPQRGWNKPLIAEFAGATISYRKKLAKLSTNAGEEAFARASNYFREGSLQRQENIQMGEKPYATTIANSIPAMGRNGTYPRLQGARERGLPLLWEHVA
jgi:hypothetical protein